MKSPKRAEVDPIKDDFRNFLFLVWQHVSLPDPTPVQYDIAQFLQHGPRRRIIEAFRGVGKSWITVGYVCWRLYRDPEEKILVISASRDLSDNFTTFALRLIKEMPLLRHLVPKADQRESKIQFDVGPARASKDPSVKSVGIFGQIAGTRATVIVADDIEVPKTSETQAMRDKLAERVKEFDAVLKPNGEVVYLGTPQTEMSLYNALPERGYVIRVWPARVPDEKGLAKYGDRLAPIVRRMAEEGRAGRTTDPRRFSDDDLLERELSYGRSGFALQFMLDTSLSDADRYPLKLGDLMVMALNTERAPLKMMWSGSAEYVEAELPNVGFSGDRFYRPGWVDKDWAEYTGSVMAIDPSGRGKDETGYAVVKALHGYLFVLEVGGLRGGYVEKNLLHLARVAHKHKVNKIIIEPNFGDGMFTQLLKPVLLVPRKASAGEPAWEGYQCNIEDSERSNAQKEHRIIDSLEPVMNQHRLVMCRSVIEADYDSTLQLPAEDINRYRLFYQMTRLTRDKGALVRDDRLDALALAVHFWTQQMARQVDKSVAEHKARLLDKELRKFKKQVFAPALKGVVPARAANRSGLGLRPR